MTYGQIKLKDARLCCKRHSRKCIKCPLRRERKWTDEKGQEQTTLLFCTFVLLTLYDEGQEEAKQVLLEEEIHHEEEWKKWVDSLESQE